MPELPEVQTVVNDLQTVVGDIFTDFVSLWPKAIKGIAPGDFAKKIKGRRIVSIKRIAKNIYIILDNENAIVLHLKMTGKIIISNQQSVTSNLQNENKHRHHIFKLRKHILEFHDIRKFATISLYDKKEVLEAKDKYGIDPIDPPLKFSDLKNALNKKPKRAIKEILMDNSVIVGIGNIYASEILFDAKIHPKKLVKNLSEIELKHLHASILKILRKAVRLRGTSVSDYRDTSGKKGSFQNHLYVYKRHGKPCKICDTMIERSVIGQRSTFHCPRCQG